MNESIKYSKSQFIENNPSYEPNIEDIYLKVADQLEGLEPNACRVILSSFLALNYSHKYKDLVEEIIKTYISDYMIKNNEFVIDDFAQRIKKSRIVSDEEQIKFSEVERLYQENGLAKNQRIFPKCR